MNVDSTDLPNSLNDRLVHIVHLEIEKDSLVLINKITNKGHSLGKKELEAYFEE